jgi:hypothetical protein
MIGLIGQLVRKGDVDDPDGDPILRPVREFSRGEAARLGEQAAQSFLQMYGNLLSCFELHGEFSLWKTLENCMRTKGLLPEVLEAAEDGDRTNYVRALVRSQEKAFVDLYGKGALARLQIVDALPREAMNEWLRMEQSVRAFTAPVVTAATVQATASPVVTETPVEVAAREWKELSGDQFRVKYLNHQGNRKFYEEALAQGLIR